MNGQDIYSQPGVYRGIPDETDDEPSDTKGVVASVATLLFSLPALGTRAYRIVVLVPSLALFHQKVKCTNKQQPADSSLALSDTASCVAVGS